MKLHLWIGLLALVAANCGTLAAPPAQTVLRYLVLEGEPAAAVKADSRAAKLSTVRLTRERLAAISVQQAEVRARLDATGVEVVGQYSRLANALKVRVPAAQAEQLERLAGVARVEPVRLYYRQTSDSVPFVRAPLAWGAHGAKADGRGVRIGLIDTGVDYTHADFGGSGDPADFISNDPTRIEPGTFPTSKVVGGYDFAGNSYDPSSFDPVRFTPFPDPDPLDCNGHGTHVAGIAAGFGVLTNGRTYKGPYSASLNLQQFSIGPGVAPQAELYAIKIFGCDGPTDLILEALEWAADPDGDGDFTDHLDVVNLSLGSSFGQVSPDDVALNAANHLSELGCVVVVAAGNSGNIYYTIAAPGVASRAISVGNSLDSRFASAALEVLSPRSIAGLYEAVEGVFTAPLSRVGPISNTVVYLEPSRACEELTNADQVRGRIALIDRGICFFSEKIMRAQEAGAVAVIMVNNVDEPPITMAGTNDQVTIPAVMISRADGDTLKSALRFNPTVRLDSSLSLPDSDLADQLAGSSSRGPSSPGSLLKPELTAPGEAIFSAAVGTGTNSAGASGTSMSTPHVTGAAGLLKQLHPTWSVEEIKSALMNTASVTRDGEGVTYPETRGGAGRLHVAGAVQTELTAAADGATGLVSLSFGALSLTNAYAQTRQIRLTNHSTNALVVDVTVRSTVSETGAELVPFSPVASIPPKASVLLPFELRADPTRFARAGDATTPTRLSGEPRHIPIEASGLIEFRSSNSLATVPYHAILRAGSDYSVTVTNIGAPLGSNVVTVTLPIRGASAHPESLASVFELGALSPNRKLKDPIFAAADLLAVGAATDFATQDSTLNSTLYFGIATSAPWTTPQSFLVDLEVVIDVDRDGVIDFSLVNASDGGLANFNLTDPEVANDVFLTVIRDTFTEDLFPGGYLNIYPADARDTAPFNNSVLVLSAPAALLGLSEGNSKFSYKVVSRGPDSSSLVDQTPWIPFDAARPAVDTAVFGLDGQPTITDGSPIRVRVNRAAAAGAGYSAENPLQVLLLHHFNPTARQVEVIRLDLESDDIDRDEMADGWEIEHFSDLTSANGTTDHDQDGFPDRLEFHAGTDVHDVASALRIVAVVPARAGNEVQWTSSPGKVYHLERAASLAPGSFQIIAPDLAATPPLNTWLDTTASSPGAYYYRVRLVR